MPILSHWDEIELHASNPLVRKRSVVGKSATWVHVTIAAGVVADRHSHPFEQFVEVVAGAGTLETEEGSQRFRAGSFFHFPAETWHAAKFDEDTVLVETNLSR